MKQVLTNQGATAEKDLVIRIARLSGIGSVKKKVAQRIGAVVSGERRNGAVITRQDDGRIRLVPTDTQ